MTIRQFQIDDYDAVIALWQRAGLLFKPKGRDSRAKIAAEMKHGVNIFLVAEADGTIVGSVFGTHEGRKGWINRLAVTPEIRRQGVARKLVTAVEERLASLGIDIVACLIEDWNTTSIKTFERLGYQHQPDVLYFTKRRSPDT
jgi:ribosomal protein S18 acetylase RimI-like enzyme